MDNDRVHTLDAGPGGSGLPGLGERLAGLGGSITTGHPRSGHFRLEASLPACGQLEGISSGGSAKVTTVTVAAVVPDTHGRCNGASDVTQTVALGPVDNPPGAPPPRCYGLGVPVR